MFIPKKTAHGVVALFSASDDTRNMVQKLLLELGHGQSLILCDFADVKNGITDFEKYIERYNPEVVIFDISPPYEENWAFFKTMRDADSMRSRGLVLTTTNKFQLDEVLGEDSFAFEVVGRPDDRERILGAIKRETTKATAARLAIVVALFNANDDTVDMVERMLGAGGLYRLAACHFSELKKGNINFATYLAAQNPAVVIFDISPPYEENWQFFEIMRDSEAMEGRAVVLTTTNKARLDEILGKDSTAIEIIGKPYNMEEITRAIDAACCRAATSTQVETPERITSPKPV